MQKASSKKTGKAKASASKKTTGKAKAAVNQSDVNVPSASATLAVMSATSPVSGRSFTIHRTAQLDPYEAKLTPAQVAAVNDAAAAAPSGDGYQGKDRMAAKLTLGTGGIKSFADTRELDAALPAPSKMLKHKPPIGTGPSSGRVEEEQQNVRVRAFLYAASRENDNDFHLIIGLATSEKPNVCMNVEISGIPDTANKNYKASGLPDPSKAPYSTTVKKLKSARNAFKKFFGSDVPQLGYDFYNPPIPVEIEGALFFDRTHGTGQKPGPAKLRPFIRTVWEIHPISKIKFEP
jgi:hypothetical protein